MPWSTTDMTWNHGGRSYPSDVMTDLFHCPPQELPCEPFTEGWQWSTGAATASTPAWNAFPLSQIMQRANTGRHLESNMLSNDIGNFDPACVRSPTPNIGLNFPSGDSVPFINPHTGCDTPNGQYMPARGEAEGEGKRYKNEGSHQTSGAQHHVFSQLTMKKTRKTSQYVAWFH